MKNNKTGETLPAEPPSRVAFRIRTLALWALIGAFVGSYWTGYTGRLGSSAAIPIIIFSRSWKYVLLPAASVIHSWYVRNAAGKYDALSAEGARAP